MKIRFPLTELPKSLKRIRRHAKITQREMASKLGYNSPVTISHYERGERSVPIEAIVKIFDECGYDVYFCIEQKPNLKKM